MNIFNKIDGIPSFQRNFHTFEEIFMVAKFNCVHKIHIEFWNSESKLPQNYFAGAQSIGKNVANDFGSVI